MSEIFNLEIDIDLKEKFYFPVSCKQNDDINLIFNVYNNSVALDLSNFTCRLRALKSDLKPLIQRSNIDISGNVITIGVDEQLTTTSGLVQSELQLIDKTTNLKKHSFNINIRVIPSVLQVDRTISKATYDLLTELEYNLDKVDGIEINWDKAEELNTSLIAENNKATSNISSLKTENDKAPSNIAALKTENDRADSNIPSLKTENDNADDKLDKFRLYDTTNLIQQVQDNTTQLNQNTNEISNIKTDYALKTDVNTLASNKADKTALETTNTNVAKNSTDIATQTARIDSFTKLAEGSTTGDAELQDIRVQADGTTSATAGDSVRSQFSNLNKNKTNKSNSRIYKTVGASNNYYEFIFEVGHTYRIKNKSSVADVNIKTILTKDNRTVVETVCSGLKPSNMILFTCAQSAKGIYIYSSDSSRVDIIDTTNIKDFVDAIGMYTLYDVSLYGVLPTNSDNFDALKTFIDSLQTNNIVLYFPKGTYNFEKHTERIILPNTCSLVGDGIDETTIFFNDSDKNGVSLFQCGANSITMDSISFSSTFNTNRTKTNIAFLLFGETCRNIHIQNCKFSYFRGICMSVNNASDVTIEHSEYRYIGRDCNRFLNAKKTNVHDNIFDHCGDDVVAFTQIDQGVKSDNGHQFYNNRLSYSMGLCYLGCSNVYIHDNQFIRYMYIVKAGKSPEESINEGGESWNINVEQNTFTTPICSVDNGQGRFSSRFCKTKHVRFKYNIFTKPETVDTVNDFIFIENWVNNAACDNYLTTVYSNEDNEHFIFDGNYFYNQFSSDVDARLLKGVKPKNIKLTDNFFTNNKAMLTTLELNDTIVTNNYFGFSKSGILCAYNGTPLIDKNNRYIGLSGYLGSSNNIVMVSTDTPVSPENIENIKVDDTGSNISMKVKKSSEMPTVGTYFKGDFVYCSNVNNNEVFGWKRITNGSSHILGTDWIAISMSSIS